MGINPAKMTIMGRLFRPEFARFRRILFIALGVALFTGLTAFIYLASGVPRLISRLENPQNNLASTVYSADNKELGAFYEGENRTNISLDQIPPHLLNALVATEDVRFYKHSGIDAKAFVNAILSIFTSVITGDVRGGSSITQQLARNVYDKDVGKQRTAIRKFKEAIAAIYLERTFTKKEIILHYLNTVPFGGTIFGIQAASRHYFNKDVKDISLAEAAILVGMLRAPSAYNPHKYPDRAKRVRNVVLSQMEKYDFITEAEAAKIKQQPIQVSQIRKVHKHTIGLATYFREYLRFWVKKTLEENDIRIIKNGRKVIPDIYTDGLKIYTTIDTRVQKAAEEGMRDHLKEHQKVFDRHIKNREPWKKDTTIITKAMTLSQRYKTLKAIGESEQNIKANFRKKTPMRVFSWHPPGYIDTVMSPWDSLKYYARFLEPGMVVISPNDGHIKAWVGGIDNEFFHFDHVATGKRQVGSTFKPFVYAVAFDNGYSPCMTESNDPVTIITDIGQEWTPRNSDEKYGGRYTLKQAIMYSINVIAARVIDKVKPAQVVDYAKRMGIQSELLPYHSIALGTFDLSVLELASAYATIAAQGRYHEPIFVTRIEDRNGNLLYKKVSNSKIAIKHETAYLLSDALRAVVTGGTAANLHWQYKVPQEVFIAGKTGTTNNFTDGWFAGFSPYYAAAVWVGHSDQRVHFNYSWEGQGGRMAMPIFANFMRKVYEDPDLNLDRTKIYPPPARFTVETNCARYQEINPNEGTVEVSKRKGESRARTDEFFD